ncbi:MAG: hypothetical protein RR614_00345 [Eubacterium sp.]
MRIIDIQNGLKTLGYDPGALDNLDGPKQEVQSHAFRKMKALPKTVFLEKKPPVILCRHTKKVPPPSTLNCPNTAVTAAVIIAAGFR